MAAFVETLQRHSLPILVIGLVSGLLALIPLVGWLLGGLVFLFAWRYAQRTYFIADFLVVMAIWLMLRWLHMEWLASPL